jgi:hypothetical protein
VQQIWQSHRHYCGEGAGREHSQGYRGGQGNVVPEQRDGRQRRARATRWSATSRRQSANVAVAYFIPAIVSAALLSPDPLAAAQNRQPLPRHCRIAHPASDPALNPPSHSPRLSGHSLLRGLLLSQRAAQAAPRPMTGSADQRHSRVHWTARTPSLSVIQLCSRLQPVTSNPHRAHFEVASDQFA